MTLLSVAGEHTRLLALPAELYPHRQGVSYQKTARMSRTFFRFCEKNLRSGFTPCADRFFRLPRSRLTVAADDPGDGGGQLFVAVRVEMLAIERTHLRERAGIEKAQAVSLGDHAVLLRHALRHGE